MAYNIYFDVASLILSILFLIFFSLRKKIPNQFIRIFYLLIVTNIVALTFDIISARYISSMLPSVVKLSYVTNAIYYVVLLILYSEFFVYFLTYLRSEKLSRNEKRTMIIIDLVYALLFIINYSSHIIFYFDENYVFQRGPLHFVLILYVGFGLAYIIADNFRNNAHEKADNSIFVNLATILLMLVYLFQFLYPEQLLIGTATTFDILLLYATFMPTEHYINSYLDVFNRKGLEAYISNISNEVDTVYIYLCNNIDYYRIELLIGNERTKELQKQLSQNFINIVGDTNVFEHSIGKYVLIVRDKRKIKDITDIINEFSAQKVSAKNIDYYFSSVIGYLAYPIDVNTSSNLLDVIDYFFAKEDIPRTVLNHLDKSLLSKRRELQCIEVINEFVEDYKTADIKLIPIKNSRDNKLFSNEMLFVFKKGNEEYFSRKEIINIAYKINKITLIDMAIFKSATEMLENGTYASRLNINISVNFLDNDSNFEYLLSYAKNNQTIISRIIIEIREVSNDYNRINFIENINKLISIGYVFALSDYGQGYNDISFLLDVKFAYVKIDKTFVKKSMSSTKSKIILERLVELLLDLDKQIIIDGIDTSNSYEYICYKKELLYEGYYLED